MKLCTNSQKYIEQLVFFCDLSHAYVRFILWPIQVKLLNLFLTSLGGIVLKIRQTGATQTFIADSLIQCLFVPNFKVLILSYRAEDVKKCIERFLDFYERIPAVEDLQPDAHVDLMVLAQMKALNPVIAKTGKRIIFKNGSFFESTPASAGRGSKFSRIGVDEAAWISITESKTTLRRVKTAIGATTARTGGQVFFISTANGDGEFQDDYWKAKRKETTIKALFMGYWDCPLSTEAAREKMKVDFGEDYVNQEFPVHDWQAFLSSGRKRFDTEGLLALQNKVLEPIATFDISWEEDEKNFRFVDKLIVNDNGNFTLYEEYSQTAEYIVVSDVAEGLDKGDFTHNRIMNRDTLRITADWHGKIEAEDNGLLLASIGRLFNNALIVVEASKDGASSLTTLRTIAKYPAALIFQHNRMSSADFFDDFNRIESVFGWVTTMKTRPAILNRLGELIQKKLLPCVTEGDISELMSFIIHKGKAQAANGKFDDRVITLAISYYLLTNDTFHQVYPASEKDLLSTCLFCSKNVVIDKTELTGYCKETGARTTKNRACSLSDPAQTRSE